MRVRGALPPLAGAVLAAALFPLTGSLDVLAREGQLGPGFWPRLALVGLALACVAKAREAWARAPGAAAARPPLEAGRLGGAMALVIGYVVAAPWLGFPFATMLFVAAFMWLCGARDWRGLAGSAVAGTVALLYLFVKVVYLPLPKGDGPFEAMTVALYRALGIF